MRILLAHNYYQQPGGEDEVFATESALLEAHGHEVVRYTLHNDRVAGMGRVQLALATVFNREVYREIESLVRKHRIEVAHFHNTFPLISPAGHSAARAGGAAVVQTIHNFRLMCLNAVLFRDGRVCEDCVGGVPWRGVMRACYRGDRAASIVSAGAMLWHRATRSWWTNVDVFVALSELSRRKLTPKVLPAKKMCVKPNCVYPDPGAGVGGGGYAVFVGRLSAEKGLTTLLWAWEQLGDVLPLKIIGDGPLADEVRAAVRPGRVEWLGRRPLAEVHETIGRAELLVFPSECYETFGRVAAEAFAKSTPVVASSAGAGAEIVEDGRTGRLFRSGDAADLAQQVRWMMEDKARLAAMRAAARAEYEHKYSGEKTYEQLMGIYQRAMTARRGA